jgi:hypothetical protein
MCAAWRTPCNGRSLSTHGATNPEAPPLISGSSRPDERPSTPKTDDRARQGVWAQSSSPLPAFHRVHQNFIADRCLQERPHHVPPSPRHTASSRGAQDDGHGHRRARPRSRRRVGAGLPTIRRIRSSTDQRKSRRNVPTSSCGTSPGRCWLHFRSGSHRFDGPRRDRPSDRSRAVSGKRRWMLNGGLPSRVTWCGFGATNR